MSRDIYYIIRRLNEMNERRKEKKFYDLCENDYAQSCKFFYKKMTGKRLRLRNPILFNEKIQWLKINEIKPNLSFYTKCADKYAVREWIKEKGYASLLVDLIGVYDSPYQIPFNELPDKFVLKLNNASGFNIVCTDKNTLDLNSVKEKLNKWHKTQYWLWGGEIQYRDIQPKIICEKYLESSHGGELVDYKFFCYGGKVLYIDLWIDHNETDGTKKAKYVYIDRNYEYALVNSDTMQLAAQKQKLKLPDNISEMIEVAEELSSGIPFVRCDLYSVDGKIYFGEMTFTPRAGVDPNYTYEGQILLGEHIECK